ncbi:MAG: HAD-IIA family hydrolase [Ilumatobacteraceae bacterium]
MPSPITPSSTSSSVPCVVLCDLDGVVWLARHPIPGSVEAIAALRAAGHRVVFVTNNSYPPVEDSEDALEWMGIPARGDVLTSAQAAAQLLDPGESAYVCGGPGIVQALTARGVEVRDDGPVDAVVVGFHREFDYDGLARASAKIRAGARLIATNDDATYPTPDGPIPGGGSILAAVATASGATPLIAGKPYAPMGDLVAAVVGRRAALDAVMVGDRPDTDGRFARAIGCRFALVYTGVTKTGEVVDPVPDMAVADLAEVAAVLAVERTAATR